MSPQILDLRRQLVQLDELFKAGTLPQDQYDEARQRVERQLLDLIRLEPAQEPATKPSWRLPAAIGVVVAAVAIGGYFWVGSPGGADVAPATPVAATPDAGPKTGGGAAHPLSNEKINAMAEGLAARLKENPKDAAGWAMLARSYAMMGRHAESVTAYKQAAALIPQDAQLLADYADSLAMTNKGSLEGEPSQLIERALKIDPSNLKALSLAGTAAFNRGDYTAAIKNWEKVVQTGPADNEIVQRAQTNIEEARQIAGKVTESGPSASGSSSKSAVWNAPADSVPSAAAGNQDASKVSGVVTLAPALAKQVAPGDTVFVFARAAEGPRMPIAIVRHRVSDLPLKFVLDDGNSMSAKKLSDTAGAVVVEARVSKSGDAQAQAGDLRGVSAAVKPGTSGLKIEIGEQIR